MSPRSTDVLAAALAAQVDAHKAARAAGLRHDAQLHGLSLPDFRSLYARHHGRALRHLDELAIESAHIEVDGVEIAIFTVPAEVSRAA